MFSAFKRWLAPDVIKEAVEELYRNRNGLPLLKLIVDGTVKWGPPRGRYAHSTDGNLTVNDDMYFYLYVNRNGGRYSTMNLVDQEMSDMLECAAINQSRLSSAVDKYTPFLQRLEKPKGVDIHMAVARMMAEAQHD